MASETTSANGGPALLDERSIGGIFVHPITFLTTPFGGGFIVAGLIYLLSGHEFTRENARNAFNWYLTVFLFSIGSVVVFFLGADDLTIGGETTELSLLPGPLDAIVGFLGIVLLFVTMLAWFATLVFAIVATVKAIFGTAWHYPFAWELLGRTD